MEIDWLCAPSVVSYTDQRDHIHSMYVCSSTLAHISVILIILFEPHSPTKPFVHTLRLQRSALPCSGTYSPASTMRQFPHLAIALICALGARATQYAWFHGDEDCGEWDYEKHPDKYDMDKTLEDGVCASKQKDVSQIWLPKYEGPEDSAKYCLLSWKTETCGLSWTRTQTVKVSSESCFLPEIRGQSERS